ncbi:GNAT family N-acetyltransferase [Actinoplanes sp. KI2]|uniref:GNAT family N-acetyltransferase n=1 Tax=Actinoplanes sp. KI2 TaxID=2983315 RepID=UPI0021D5A5F3|nr:GNAT family N-acetyltransferase [Actinoplanes sp. KI2]MCU7726023.1 GNAT family N-acetyltransferase [Actinoplanes sp. KI2]
MDGVIVRAGAVDESLLLPLVREFCEVDRHPFERERVLAGLRPLLADDRHGQVWLIRDPGGELAGYAVLTWGWSLESGGRECLLDEIYVRTPGRGLGGRALAALVEAAAAAGASAMFLETEAHNERARAFYRRGGFEAEDSIWMSRSW